MLEKNQLYHGDCLEIMKGIDDKAIDMILCDLPYGTTACSWDVIIPFDKLWEQYERIIKDNGAIVLTASQPFTSALVMSNKKMFKYSWIWVKSKAGEFFNAKLKPMKIHEDVLVFSKGKTSNGNQNNMLYFPQNLIKDNKVVKGNCKGGIRDEHKFYRHSHKEKLFKEFTNYPTSILKFDSESETIHGTQKPVFLFEYLIKTYTDEGDLVLDNCIGSGTTAIAALNTNRNYIGIEKDETYYNVASDRISKHVVELNTNLNDMFV